MGEGELAGVAATILVVDDDRMTRTLIARRLKRSGYVVELAESGRLGLQRLSAGDTTYSLVLLDLLMPEFSGFEFLAAARNLPDVGTPIIVMSADRVDENLERCRELGAVAFLQKPVQADALLEEIQRVLGTRAG